MIETEKITLKALRLTNALSISLPDKGAGVFPNTTELALCLDKLSSFIALNNALPIGPLILKTSLENERFISSYIQQVDYFIQNVAAPLRMDALIDFPLCAVIEFEGEEKDLMYSYYKFKKIAREQNITFSKDLYALFISQNDEDSSCMVEIFMPIPTC